MISSQIIKWLYGNKALQVMMVMVRLEEHTSELQSLTNLVCRLLLEKKKKEQPKYETKGQKNQRKREKPQKVLDRNDSEVR